MKKTFEDLVSLTSHLRSPEGCPWDKEQNLMSIRNYVIEEAFEVVQAIESESIEDMIEEFGDLLLQVVFASQIAKDEDKFDITDVLDQLHNKLVRRHPHVFGEKKANVYSKKLDIYLKGNFPIRQTLSVIDYKESETVKIL